MAVHGHEEKRLSPVVAVIAIVAAAVIGLVAGYFIGSPPGLKDVPDSTAELEKAQIDSTVLPVKGSPSKGSNTAPVTIVEFGDFQCQACAGSSDAIVDRAMREYGKDTVRVVWKHLPLNTHPDARRAAQAAWAAQQQGKFWEFHDKVFGAFPSDAKEMGTFLKADKLVEYASDINLNVDQFKRDMDSPEAAAAVAADESVAEALGLRSTPAIFVNGRRANFSQGVSFDVLKALVDEERSKANSLAESPNAYYAYAVFANRALPDGIKTGPMGAEAVAALGGQPSQALPGAADTAQPSRVPTPTNAQVAPTPGGAGPDISKMPVKGNPNAKVTIIEYSDFECPFCSKVNPTIDQVLKTYPNDVRVAFAQHPLAFHKNAPLAHQAALAAHEQGKFWQYHDLLFANQKALTRPDLEKYAQQLGLDMGKFNAALDSGKFKAQVDADMASAKQFGVTGTPSFVVNGVKFVGAQPFDAFKKTIDEQIARADQVAKQKGLQGEALYAELVKSAPKEAPPAPAAAKPAEEGRFFVETGNSPVLGKPDAPVTIMEFSDFECPFCSKGGNTLKELQKANPDTVKVVFKHFPLDFHKNAPLAHRASIAAANQGKFWEYHDLLFANQRALQRDNLVSYAQQLGLDMNKFNADLDNADLDKQIDGDKAAGGKVGVRGTPHFFINGTRFSGAQPLPAFQAAVDRELEVAQKYIKKGVAADKLYQTIVNEEKTPEAPKVEVDIKGAPMKGAANGKVTIIEFSDFECPFCSKVNPTIDQLLKTYPNDVKVVFKHQPLAFHKNAPLAAEASLAAHAQGKFWEYHDLLFANQKALTRPDLEKYAQQLGLDMNKFKADLDNGTFKKQVEADMEQARSAGISGTPSFLINGTKFVGAQPFERFDEQVKAALGK